MKFVVSKKKVKKQPFKKELYLFIYSIKNLSLNGLKLITKSMGIKGYKSMSEERLISSINESVKESENNFDDARIETIKKDFNELGDKKIKEIRKNLYRIKSKNKREKSFLKLEKHLPKLKKYYDYDDIEYRWTRDVKNLFDL